MSRNLPKRLANRLPATLVAALVLGPAMSVEAAPATPAPAPAKVAPLTLPPITETTLPNGLSVVTVQKKSLPLVAVRLVVPAGAARDPKGKDGIAAFASGLIRRGTKARTADQIDDAIESIGGLLGVDAGYESTSLAVTVPSEQTPIALEVIADLVRNATFPKAEFDLAKRRELSQLKQDLDDPSTVADRALVRFFYGKDHPYGHSVQGAAATVKTFKREDVTGFYKQHFTPQGSLLLFVGDIEPKAAAALAEKLFGAWKGPELTPLTIPAPASPKGVEFLLVDKSDATQAQVRAAVPGLARKDPRFYAATIANTVVGGGFTSRLVDEIRVNRGLSYSVSTRLVALREVGAISYSTFTKTETVRELLETSFKVLGDFRASGPTKDEADKARRYVIGLYPSRVESIDQLAEALAGARIVGLPFEAIGAYRSEVAAATPADIAAAAKLYPSGEGAKIVIVGNAAKIRPQLEGLGTVTTAKVEEFE